MLQLKILEYSSLNGRILQKILAEYLLSDQRLRIQNFTSRFIIRISMIKLRICTQQGETAVDALCVGVLKYQSSITWHGLPNIEKPLIPARWYKIKFFFLYIIVLKHPSDIQSIKQINKIDENLLFFQFYGCFLFTFHDFIIYAILFAKC